MSVQGSPDYTQAPALPVGEPSEPTPLTSNWAVYWKLNPTSDGVLAVTCRGSLRPGDEVVTLYVYDADWNYVGHAEASPSETSWVVINAVAGSSYWLEGSASSEFRDTAMVVAEVMQTSLLPERNDMSPRQWGRSVDWRDDRTEWAANWRTRSNAHGPYSADFAALAGEAYGSALQGNPPDDVPWTSDDESIGWPTVLAYPINEGNRTTLSITAGELEEWEHEGLYEDWRRMATFDAIYSSARLTIPPRSSETLVDYWSLPSSVFDPVSGTFTDPDVVGAVWGSPVPVGPVKAGVAIAAGGYTHAVNNADSSEAGPGPAFHFTYWEQPAGSDVWQAEFRDKTKRLAGDKHIFKDEAGTESLFITDQTLHGIADNPYYEPVFDGYALDLDTIFVGATKEFIFTAVDPSYCETDDYMPAVAYPYQSWRASIPVQRYTLTQDYYVPYRLVTVADVVSGGWQVGSVGFG